MPRQGMKALYLPMTAAEHKHVLECAKAQGLTLVNWQRDALAAACEAQGKPLEFPHSVAGRPRGKD